ncbi:hypothetical protein CMV_021442 [Castanea mollissima]|uniref:Uncharacterized protein n=1 Tax=Castanea mollissima TaxID=60419 RepID=A0A8J4QW66_9ROSI|nr:hypothetical protein CMV_021442 [Castanea mollissima]
MRPGTRRRKQREAEFLKPSITIRPELTLTTFLKHRMIERDTEIVFVNVVATSVRLASYIANRLAIEEKSWTINTIRPYSDRVRNTSGNFLFPFFLRSIGMKYELVLRNLVLSGNSPNSFHSKSNLFSLKSRFLKL